MLVDFSKSKKFTIGIELELLLIDPKTLKPASLSPEVLEILHSTGNIRFKSEFNRATVELDTPVCHSIEECRSVLSSNLELIQNLGKEKNFSVIATATHPFTPWMEMKHFPSERYEHLINKLQIIAKRVHVYGLHVHIGLSSGEEALTVVNESLKYLPHLLALSTNSPFWGGVDTGLESFRFGVMSSLPYADIPPYFSDWTEFSLFFNILKNRKIIEKMKDLYWHVRPSPDFGTVEFRVFDIPPTLDEALALAALVQSLVIFILEDVKKHPEKRIKDETVYALLPENLMMAQRYGLEGEIFTGSNIERVSIREEVHHLLEKLKPIAVEYENAQELQTIYEILHQGTGAKRQRNIFKKSKNLLSVVEMLNKSLIPRILQK